MDRTAETAKLASIVALLAAGLGLFAASPLLLIAATVDVSTGPSTIRDIVDLVGLPWLAYAGVAVVAGALMRRRRNLMALAIAAMPAAAEVSVYLLLRSR